MFIDTGQAGFVEVIGTVFPLSIDHPNSVHKGISGLEMCALLSMSVARAALFRCRRNASSVGVVALRVLICCSGTCMLLVCPDLNPQSDLLWLYTQLW